MVFFSLLFGYPHNITILPPSKPLLTTQQSVWCMGHQRDWCLWDAQSPTRHASNLYLSVVSSVGNTEWKGNFCPWVITSPCGPEHNHAFMSPRNPHFKTEVLLGKPTIHVLFLSSRFFYLERGFADRCVKVHPPRPFCISLTAVDSQETALFLFLWH